ncbi:RNA-binding protein Raly-like [Schistocerca americana]|uniref:RNA-binding protein Raly-like n=1 Tax=Schistocerca americana TaxID=7009 RepID=UPI001F500EAC|nr:RNA-binding protein Raly-like [Schistocerca americana]
MKMSKVGNQTNSQDPQAVNSRVFVGNLNTFQCSKTDVERMFQRYGRIAGISMHKGYAFVQFTNPFDARSACLGEDARTVLGQVLDVNMVAEPKPHQTGRKRQNVAKTGNDWDYYYDSYYASAAFPPRIVPPPKRPRLMAPPARPTLKAVATPQHSKTVPQQAPQQLQSQPTAGVGQLKTYSNPDILICGNCREMFTELQELLEHKKTYCKLRFTCKCHTLADNKSPGEDGTVGLLCAQCKDVFPSAWDLMVHVQAAHMLNIYQLGAPRAALNGAPAGATPATPAAAASASPVKEEHQECRGEREGTPAADDDDDVTLAEVPLPADEKQQVNGRRADGEGADIDELLMDDSAQQSCTVHIEQTPATRGPAQLVLKALTNGEIGAVDS